METISTIEYKDNKTIDFSKHIDYVETLHHVIENEKEYVKAETFFKGNNDKSDPYLKSFSEAFKSGFINGHAKFFCSLISYLCTNDLYFSVSMPMASYVYGFKLKRIREESLTSESSSNGSEMVTRSSAKTCEMWVSENNFNLTSHYLDGKSVCDIATVITNESKTAVV